MGGGNDGSIAGAARWPLRATGAPGAHRREKEGRTCSATRSLAPLALRGAQTLPPLPRALCGEAPLSTPVWPSPLLNQVFSHALSPLPGDSWAWVTGSACLCMALAVCPSAQWTPAYPSSKTGPPCPWAWRGQLRQALHRFLPQLLRAQETPVPPLDSLL